MILRAVHFLPLSCSAFRSKQCPMVQLPGLIHTGSLNLPGVGRTQETCDVSWICSDVEGCLRRLPSSNRRLKGQESLRKVPHRRSDVSNTADEMIVRQRARIKYVFGSRWSVHLVKCSDLKYFLRGFLPHKATPGVVLADTSPMTDLAMAMIRRKQPGDVQKQEIRP